MEARRKQISIFQEMKEKNMALVNSVPGKTIYQKRKGNKDILRQDNIK